MRGVRHLLALGTAAVCGVLLYCLRLRFPNPLTEALGPANASPWETGKLVFWAMLPAAALLAAAMALGVHALALGRLGGDALPWYGAVILLAVAYLLFSILPPTGRLFAEQAGVPAASIPF